MRAAAAMNGASSPHSPQPDPSCDQHIAFPDEPRERAAAPSSLPRSAWAKPSQPDQNQVPPELAHVPPEVIALLTRIAARRRPHRRRHGRLSPGGLALTAVVGLALIMGTNTSEQPDSSGAGTEQGWGQDGQWYDGTSGGLELLAIEEVADATIQPVDQPRYEIPLGPSTVRIEVVSDDPAGDVVVTSDSGDAQVGEVVLPFGAEMRLDGPPDRLAVTARSQYGEAEIQCRVYADDLLVSIATGVGIAECLAEPAG